MYPTDREFFGSEPSFGVDGDPRIYIVYVRGTGVSNAGYYSTPDEYNPLVKEYSNGHEMFFFNADNMDLGAEDTYGTLAHEFQHMIHWNTDRNEASWINEGFSMVAELLNDYPIYFDYYYVTDPDINLTDWSPNPVPTDLIMGNLSSTLPTSSSTASAKILPKRLCAILKMDCQALTQHLLNSTSPIRRREKLSPPMMCSWIGRRPCGFKIRLWAMGVITTITIPKRRAFQFPSQLHHAQLPRAALSTSMALTISRSTAKAIIL